MFKKETWTLLAKILAIVFLIIAVLSLGMILFDSIKSDNILIQVQLGSIIYIALLSVGLFYENYKNKLVNYFHNQWIGKLGWVFVGAFIVDLIWTEYIYWAVTKTAYIPLLCAAALAVGLFFSGQAINHS